MKSAGDHFTNTPDCNETEYTLPHLKGVTRELYHTYEKIFTNKNQRLTFLYAEQRRVLKGI